MLDEDVEIGYWINFMLSCPDCQIKNPILTKDPARKNIIPAARPYNVLREKTAFLFIPF
jgi:hypothetical protein